MAQRSKRRGKRYEDEEHERDRAEEPFRVVDRLEKWLAGMEACPQQCDLEKLEEEIRRPGFRRPVGGWGGVGQVLQQFAEGADCERDGRRGGVQGAAGGGVVAG